jgi:hypothetical protein
MNLHKDSGDSIEPCKHMESMLNRTADGTAPKAMRWFAVYHAAHCSRCGIFLDRVTSLVGHLHDLKANDGSHPLDEGLSPERWEAVEAGWAEVEK